MIRQSISRYRIVSQLGSGGMGAVYRAQDTKLDRSIALKVLAPEFSTNRDHLQRFQQEAQALAAVNHPNIVSIYSVEEVEDTHLITMELIEGQTLAEVVSDQPVEVGFFFEVMIPLAGALEAAHRQGVVHRDLKPANIMLTKDGNLKVLDFGLAWMPGRRQKERTDPEQTVSLIEEEPMVGTPHYMSPEQVRSEVADHRADIFSLGAIMYHLITGHQPFIGKTTAEILASVLKDTPVSPTALNPGCSAQLSRLIDQCLAKNPRERVQDVGDLRLRLEQERNRWQLEATSSIRAIGVLPFLDMSPNKDQEHFCTGIAEEIINALTGVEGLKVVSRMSSFQYGGMGGDTREIGRKLGVHALLEGSVRLGGDRMRVMAQLTDVSDGCHIWSQRFDCELSDIFAVQDEIAQSIVRALRLTIDSSRKPQLVEIGTQDPAAYDFYLRGREFFRRWGKRNIQIAQRMFNQAIDLDAKFASAYAGLADTFSFMFMYINSSPENLEQADHFSADALELDPAQAEAHASRGLALSLSKKHEAAMKSFGTAIKLDPNLFEAYYFHARDLVVQGRYEEAIELYNRAHAVSPDDYQIPILQAQILRALGRFAEEEEANRRGLVLAEKAILLNPEDARACYMGAGSMIRLGQEKRGLQWAKRALALDPDDPAILYNVACNLTGLGDFDEAIHCLEKTVKVGAAYKDWMANDSDLDPLRDDPRFKRLVESLEQDKT